MPSIAKVRYHHDAVIDEILMNPSISQGELARRFGFTESWLSICVNSDAFKERLAERKGELVDPRIVASINERLDAVARKSLERLIDKLDSPAPIKDADLVAMAKLGVGDQNIRKNPAVAVQNNLYVVNLPPPAPNTEAWVNNAGKNRAILPMVEQIQNAQA